MAVETIPDDTVLGIPGMIFSACNAVPPLRIERLKALPPDEFSHGLIGYSYVTTVALADDEETSVSCGLVMRAIEPTEPQASHKLGTLVDMINRLISGEPHLPMPCVESVARASPDFVPKFRKHVLSGTSGLAVHLCLVELGCSLPAPRATPVTEAWISLSVERVRLGLVFASYDELGVLECARIDEVEDTFSDIFEEPTKTYCRGC